MKSTVIRNAKVVNADGRWSGEIRIEGGVIAAMGPNVASEGCEIVDAAGKFVLPGGVDVHTHFDLDLGAFRASDSFFTGSRAAACGGTTTIVDHMGFGPDGCALKHQVDVYHGLADGNCCVDYSFHGVLQHVNDAILREMGDLIGEGIVSYKAYLTYAKKLGDEDVFRVMRRCAELGILLTVHCENDGSIAALRAEFAQENCVEPRYHPLSRPALAEAEAVNRMLLLAQMAGDAPLYIVHTSSKESAFYQRRAREYGQRNAFFETCPQYLFLDDSRYGLPGHEGLNYVMSPPLRKGEDQEALIEALRGGWMDVVATDHCPFFSETKVSFGGENFANCPGGAPGVEARMPLMIGLASKGALTWERVVEVCCDVPARLMGLAPRKGRVAVGSDADLVIVDPEVEYTLKKDMLHENVDYTPYEGMRLKGRIERTMLRGETVALQGAFVGRQGQGRYQVRSLPDLRHA